MANSSSDDTMDRQPKAPKPAKKKSTAKGRKKSEAPSKAPPFLKKTYEIFSVSDPSIACWSEDGETIVIKDEERFQNEILPQYFKSSKITSYVRQLNTYGFSKVKGDSLRLEDAHVDEESKYSKFKNDKFQRDRPELMLEIGNSKQPEYVEKTEYENLKTELKSTKERMEKLEAMVLAMQQQQVHSPEPEAKKRKLEDMAPSPVRSQFPQQEPSVVSSEPPFAPLPVVSDQHGAMPDLPPLPAVSDSGTQYRSGSFTVPTAFSRSASGSTFTSADDDLLASLFSLDGTSEVGLIDPEKLPDLPVSMDDYSLSSPEHVDPALLDQFREALATLPRELQALYVERIVAIFADPESYRRQVEALAALAESAAQEARSRAVPIREEDQPDPHLGAAVLGAYLSGYRHSHDHDDGSVTPASIQAVSSPHEPSASAA